MHLEMRSTAPSFSGLPPPDWAAAAECLDRDGVVHLPGALTPAAVHRVEAAIADSLANPSPTANLFYPGQQATFFEDRGDKHAPLVKEIGLDRMLSALWGVDHFWYLGEQLFLKEGGDSRRTPWHQDTSYLRMAGSQLVASWICIDPLPKANCLEFVRGSHRGPLYNGSAFAEDDDTAPLYAHSRLPRLPDIQANRDEFDILAWDVQPGDVIVFHLGMLHGGAGTTAGMRRRTISMRFLGPDVRYDGLPREFDGAEQGSDIARAIYSDMSEDDPLASDRVLAKFYGGLSHGDPYPTAQLTRISTVAP